MSKSVVEKPVDDSASKLGVSDNDASYNETEEATKPSTNGINSNLDGP